MVATESSGLLGGDRKELSSRAFNMEHLRAFGLLFGMVMLAVGKVLTESFVWKREDTPNKVEETYIDQLFHFPHTCVFIDFNPSKTVAAILVVAVVVPLIAFTVLNRYRLKLAAEKGEIDANGFLIKFSEATWLLRALSFTYFFLVFVNSPDGKYEEGQEDWTVAQRFGNLAWRKYLVHYLPFMFWQLALALMAIEQTWYKSVTGDIPFGISCPTLKVYTITVAVVFIYYTTYIWAHMFGFWVPLKASTAFAQFIMWFYIILTAIIPAVFALKETPRYHKIEFFSVDGPSN